MLNGYKFMPELHWMQLWFIYCVCGPFTKDGERIRNFTETSNLKYLHRNELEKGCFPHDAGYSDSKNLAKRITSDKILRDRAYEITRNSKCDGYRGALANVVYKLFNIKQDRNFLI